MAPKERRQREFPGWKPQGERFSKSRLIPITNSSPVPACFRDGLATRAVATIPHVDQDYMSRRTKRHLNDLERTNYTESTSGPTTYGEDERDAATSIMNETDGYGARSLCQKSVKIRDRG